MQFPKGSLYVSWNGAATSWMFAGASKRWDARRIGVCKSYWSVGWDVQFFGSALGYDFFCYARSDIPAGYSFEGLSGDLVIADRVNACIHIPKQEFVDRYTMTVHEKRGKWKVRQSVQFSSGIVQATIRLNDRIMIIAPGETRWYERLISFGGFVRHKWGDWVEDTEGENPAALVGCLFGIFFNNSVVGDRLAPPPP